MRVKRRAAAISVLVTVAAVLTGCRSGAADTSVAADTVGGVTPAVTATDAAAALEAWTTFPVDREPRPLLLLQPDVIDPQRGFPDGDSKSAYLDRRVKPTASLPEAPTHAGAYAVISASDAVAELGGGTPYPAGTALTVTGVTLTEHVYRTDRGDVPLPAWAVVLAGVSDPAYVLAVATDDRFDYDVDASRPDGAGSIAVRGNRLTVAFTPAHTSTGPCDPATTSRVELTENPAVVQLVIVTDVVPPPTPQSPATPIACGAVAFGSLDPPLVPGTPGTTTQTLDGVLGNRPVVDEWGTPWKVAVVG